MPLPEDEDRGFDLKCERHGLERGRVMILPKIVDQPCVAALVLASTPCGVVGNTGRASYRQIAAHGINAPHESVVENLDLHLPPSSVDISRSKYQRAFFRSS